MSASQKIDKLGEFFNSHQQQGENASDYIIRMVNLAGSEVSQETTVHTIIKGLNTDLRPFILAKEPKTIKDLNQLVKRVQGNPTTSESEKVTMLQQQMEIMQQQMQDHFAKLTARLTITDVNQVQPQRSRSPYPRNSTEQFQQRTHSKPRSNGQTTTNGQTVSWRKTCRYCGEYHSFNQNCPRFRNKKCFRCGTMGHIKSQCRKGLRSNITE